MLIVETLANMRRLHTSSCCKACLHRTVHCLQLGGGIWCILLRDMHLVQYFHLQMIPSVFREASADSQGQCRQQKPPCITHRLHKMRGVVVSEDTWVLIEPAQLRHRRQPSAHVRLCVGAVLHVSCMCFVGGHAHAGGCMRPVFGS